MASTRRRYIKKAEPVTGATMVLRALRRLGVVEAVKAQMALRAFALACGPRLCDRARAERFAHGVLYVRVESSAWANEIAFIKADLIARIQQVAGGEGVRELRFTVGPIADLPAWTEREPPQQPPARPRPVDPRVAAALTQVGDDDLRDALGALYVSSCKSGRRRP